jgi:crotonobetainyl-CoA:carnitine CoA-transferase CaiB-like acyl-CoA transferase
MKAGVPCSRYLTVAEAMADPQLAARGSLAKVKDGAGTFLVPNPPFQFADFSVGVKPTVPALGADTEQAIKSILGGRSDQKKDKSAL